MRELQTNDRVIDELLTERLPLRRILHALFKADSAEPQALDDDADPLVVEVRHDDRKAFVLLAKQVLDGEL